MCSERALRKGRRFSVHQVGVGTALLVLLVVLACGKKGDPQPPPSTAPSTTRDLVVEQWGQHLRLSFTYPTLTVGGLVLSEVAAVEIWHLAQPALGALNTLELGSQPLGDEAEVGDTRPTLTITPLPPPPMPTKAQFESEAQLYRRIEATNLAPFVLGGKFLFLLPLDQLASVTELEATRAAATASGADEAVAEGQAETMRERESATPYHVFAVRTVGPDRRESAFSNLVRIQPGDPPAPPPTVGVTAEAAGIVVRWSLPSGVQASELAAIHIYRRTSAESEFLEPVHVIARPEPTPTTPLSPSQDTRTETPTTEAPEPSPEPDPLARSSWLDRGAAFGSTYIYGVALVAQQKPLIQSQPRSSVPIEYVDRFPPPQPGRLVAFPEPAAVRLIWDAVRAPNLAGYEVERRRGDGPWKRLTSEPLLTTEWIDREVESGANCAYRVRAVDRAGNASDWTAPTSVRVP